MPASDDDREMMARFNDTFRKLKTNREQVPLEVLQTKYGKAYQKLTKEMADLADWFAARLRERMPFPMHPKGHRRESAAIAADRRRPRRGKSAGCPHGPVPKGPDR